jgi:amino acid transporter
VLLYALVASGWRPVTLIGTILAVAATAMIALIVAAPAVHPGTTHLAALADLGPALSGGGDGPAAAVAKWAFVASWSSYAAETASTVAAELRGARQAMGRVMTTSAAICLLACTLVPLALFSVAPRLVAGDPLTAFTAVARRVAGPAGGPVVGIGLAAVLILGALAFIISSSRTIYQLAEDGHLPRLFAHVNRRGAPTGSILLDAAVITTMLLVFGTNVVNVVAAANVGYLIVFVLMPLAYLSLRRVRDTTAGAMRLGRWAVPLAAGLGLFNLVLLIAGGLQWGWTVFGLGLGISLLILPVAALNRRKASGSRQCG